MKNFYKEKIKKKSKRYKIKEKPEYTKNAFDN